MKILFNRMTLLAGIMLLLVVLLFPGLEGCDSGISAAQTTSTTAPVDSGEQVNIADYRLAIDGLVNNPLTLTYQEILEYPTVSQTIQLWCGYVKLSEKEWTGVLLRTLLDEAGIQPGASQIAFYASDGYMRALPLETAQRDDTFLAYKADGQTLSHADGYPLRVVVGKTAGEDWVRFLIRIEVK